MFFYLFPKRDFLHVMTTIKKHYNVYFSRNRLKMLADNLFKILKDKVATTLCPDFLGRKPFLFPKHSTFHTHLLNTLCNHVIFKLMLFHFNINAANYILKAFQMKLPLQCPIMMFLPFFFFNENVSYLGTFTHTYPAQII